MLQSRLNNCVDCTTIPVLLSEIDCKIFSLAKKEYNNTVFDLNKCIDRGAFWDLLNYRRILTFKFCNPDYACHFTVAKIASRVKILIHK
jgi:hypothetical protein